MKYISDFSLKKLKSEKISLVTCYDYTSARIISRSDIDAVLVGDSAAMVMHGFENTIYAEIQMMCYHLSAVKRAIKDKIIIADLPFLEHKKSISDTISSIDKIMKSGAHAVKIEGAFGNLDLIETLTKAGIPVMGHLGLTPQSINAIGTYKVQGRKNAEAELIIKQSAELETAGCFAIVLELVPRDLASEITNKIRIPTIGIGAGNGTDGQVLVLQDLLGMNEDFNPKFVRKYLNGFETTLKALNSYHKDVIELKFPNDNESFV
ncbi:MAG: 3-methyl-2-oxobutanoate hydroxymethyltransferase [Bacteroidota bacterium]